MPDDLTSSEDDVNPQPTPQPKPAEIKSVEDVPRPIRDAIEAQNKRGLQQQIKELTDRNKALADLQKQTETLMTVLGDRVELKEGDMLGDVATQLSMKLDSLKTESERLAAANKKKEEALSVAQQLAEKTRTELYDTLVMHQLSLNLGGNRTVSPKASELIAKELKQFATVGEDRSITFEMDVVDPESGTSVRKAVDVATAIATLEANKDWAHFFTATVNSGAGGDVVDGVKRTNSGQVDFSALTKDPAKFFELMDKNPKIFDDALAGVR